MRRTVLLAAALPVLPAWAGRRRKLVLGAATELSDSFHGEWARLVYREALARLGYELEVRAYPGMRASMLSDRGRLDGEISRADRYGRLHPHLVRVEPAHFAITFAAYARAALRVGPGWEGLRHHGYRVEYRRGVAVCELELPAVVPPEHLDRVNGTELGLRKLAHGRSDVFVDLESVVEPMLARPAFAHAGIRKVAVMETVQMHAYLGERHAVLAKALSAQLARLKREGYVAKCRRLALKLAAGKRR